ncbi:aldo-keto reductase family 1 member B1-like [Uranotaenia lowii]|uniref:aldo-keto reductase family 1 member B1-like n=1 Tax=Uranotaenia lowii TaxID=190385 RepID=UPI00247B1554|nr:aldo-keto reductase family 1 member B1-like [Uranotaenia lowii]XP_055604097.1 aldo-keto reductase family 1 member B1-like [Uranotaenia lowii]
MDPSKVPNAIFNNGNSIPMIGLGTWGSPPGQVAQAVKDAIDIGYRHIDCAHVYQNEHEVGEGINAKIQEGVVKREEIFVTSKLWNTFHRPELVEGALRTTLKNLKLDYLDLYLIHWPQGYKEGGDLFPMEPSGEKFIFSDADYVDTWPAMEKLVDAGLVKNIGLSNFNSKQVQRVLDVARIKPVTNQIENHAYLHQAKLSAFCSDKGIIVTAYSPLGSPARPWVKEDDIVLLNDLKLKTIADKHGKEPAQILIRYQIQQGHVVIPKSVTKARIASNFDVFGFELDAEDIKQLAALERNERICPESFSYGHPHHPFEKE